MTSPTQTIAAPTYALVRAPIAPMNAEPRVSSAQVSQTLFGHAPTIIDSHGDWHRVRTLDGYEGWTHSGYLAVLDAPVPLPLNESALRDLVADDVAHSLRNGATPSGFK